MRPWRVGICALLIVAAAFGLVSHAGAADSADTARSLELTGTIDPATERWMDAALDSAAEDDVPLVIIRMDTPGGLDTSLRAIVKDILAAPMPVVVYVSPDGARAASAGVFIAQSADVVAMAPQTKIGSASAIKANGSDVGGTLGRKIENDASAFIRVLATTHGRNAELGEEMVREATNVTAEQALQQNFIDLIEPNQDALLADLNGFQIKGSKAQTLDTTGLEIENREMPFLYEVLQILVNPNISYLLLIGGLLGLGIEIFSPGLIIPGALGAISLLMGLYGSSQLPVTIAGVLLLIAGVGLLIAEAHLPTSGLLGVAGVIALVFAGLLLYDDGGSSVFGISIPVVVLVAVVLGGGLSFIVSKAVQARSAPVSTSYDEMVGTEGEVRATIDPIGQILTHGALWRARIADPGADVAPLAAGTPVRITAVDGLTVEVEPISGETSASTTTSG
ncbi:nodulation protein NfeD [soil metagenome]